MLLRTRGRVGAVSTEPGSLAEGEPPPYQSPFFSESLLPCPPHSLLRLRHLGELHRVSDDVVRAVDLAVEPRSDVVASRHDQHRRVSVVDDVAVLGQLRDVTRKVDVCVPLGDLLETVPVVLVDLVDAQRELSLQSAHFGTLKRSRKELFDRDGLSLRTKAVGDCQKFRICVGLAHS